MRLVKVEIGAKEAMERFVGHIPVVVEGNGKSFRIWGTEYPLESDLSQKKKKAAPIPKKLRHKEYLDKMAEIKKQLGEWAQIKFFRHEFQEVEEVGA